MSWTIVCDDTFTHADTTTGGAGTTTGVPTTGGTALPWTDVAGSTYSISANRLLGTVPSGATPYATSFLARPTSENALAQRIVVDYAASTDLNHTVLTALRFASPSTCYMAGYYPGNGAAGSYAIYSLIAGTLSTLTSAAFTYDSTHTYQIDFSATGSGPTALSMTLTDTTTSTVIGSLTASDSTAGVQTSGAYAVDINGGTSTPIYHTRARTYASTAPGFALSPTTATTGTSATVTATGNGATVWTSGTTFSVTGGTGASISGTSVNAGTQVATFTLTPGSTAATLTIANSTDAATATVTVSAAATAVAVTSTGIFFSPFNWYLNGSTYAQTNNPGAYLIFNFSGTTTLTMGIDLTPLSGGSVATTSYPRYRYSIDDGAWTNLQLPTTGTTVSLATGMTTGGHNLRLIVYANDTTAGDRWVTPSNVFRITGFTLDGGSLTAAPTVSTARVLSYGDSITEGEIVTGGVGYINNSDSQLTWINTVAAALNGEWGNVAFGGQGWAHAGASSVVPLFTPGDDTNSAWNKYSAGRSRLVSSLLSPAPDYVLNAHGRNDTAGAGLQSSVSGWLTAARAAAPAPCKLIGVIPFAATNKTDVLAGYATYGGTAVPHAVGNGSTYYTYPNDASLCLIDLGTAGTKGLAGPASAESNDGTHPLAAQQAVLGSLVSRAAQAWLGGSGTAQTFPVLGPTFIRGN